MIDSNKERQLVTAIPVMVLVMAGFVACIALFLMVGAKLPGPAGGFILIALFALWRYSKYKLLLYNDRIEKIPRFTGEVQTIYFKDITSWKEQEEEMRQGRVYELTLLSASNVFTIDSELCKDYKKLKAAIIKNIPA